MDDLISGATILQAIQALRDENRDEMGKLREAFEAFKAENIEKVAKLEAQMLTVIGNGQPGRLTLAEEKIGALEKVHWKQTGIVSAVVIIGSFVVEAIRKKLGF